MNMPFGVQPGFLARFDHECSDVHPRTEKHQCSDDQYGEPHPGGELRHAQTSRSGSQTPFPYDVYSFD